MNYILNYIVVHDVVWTNKKFKKIKSHSSGGKRASWPLFTPLTAHRTAVRNAGSSSRSARFRNSTLAKRAWSAGASAWDESREQEEEEEEKEREGEKEDEEEEEEEEAEDEEEEEEEEEEKEEEERKETTTSKPITLQQRRRGGERRRRRRRRRRKKEINK